MARPYDVVTFDCYGTLVDWEGGLATAFLRAGWSSGVRLERAPVLEAYMAVEREVEAGDHRSYREVLAESARGVAARRMRGRSLSRATALSLAPVTAALAGLVLLLVGGSVRVAGLVLVLVWAGALVASGIHAAVRFGSVVVGLLEPPAIVASQIAYVWGFVQGFARGGARRGRRPVPAS